MERYPKVRQLKSGAQERAYGDHVYEWEVEYPGATAEQVLHFCQSKIKDSERNRSEYLATIRDLSLSFSERMSAECSGWYTLTDNGNGHWTYKVTYPYID